MTSKILAMLFGYVHGSVKVNVAGFSHEDSLKRPEAGGNCANWVLGHMVATRNLIMELLGQPSIWDDGKAGRYQRGTEPITESSEGLKFEEILEEYDRSQQRLLDALDAADESQFAAAAGDSTVGAELAVLHFHEAYHAGQLGLLRRMIGHDGAIK